MNIQADFRGEELTAAFDLWAPFCSMSVDPPYEGEARGIFPDVFAQLAKKLNFTARQVSMVFVSRNIDANYSTFTLNCFLLAVCIRYMRRQNRSNVPRDICRLVGSFPRNIRQSPPPRNAVTLQEVPYYVLSCIYIF